MHPVGLAGHGNWPYSCGPAIARNRWRSGHGVAATASCCRDIMVMLPLVRGDHCPQVVRCPLHVLPDRTSVERAFVVAPAIMCRILPRIRVALHHFLTVLPPPVAVIKDIYVARCLNHDPRLTNRFTSGNRDAFTIILPFPTNTTKIVCFGLVFIIVPRVTHRGCLLKLLLTKRSRRILRGCDDRIHHLLVFKQGGRHCHVSIDGGVEVVGG